VAGIGMDGDPNAINYWDMGLSDLTSYLRPTNSILASTLGTILDPSNLEQDPLVVAAYDTSIQALPWRTNPHFVGVILVAVDLPPNLMGDYHLQATSPAIGAGASGKDGVDAPGEDIDGDNRPPGNVDIGADQQGDRGVQTVIPGALSDFFRTLYKVFLPKIGKH
jgi:hypothetical protein